MTSNNEIDLKILRKSYVAKIAKYLKLYSKKMDTVKTNAFSIEANIVKETHNECRRIGILIRSVDGIYTDDFIQVYEGIMRSLLSNLNIKNNDYLGNAIINGDINIKEISKKIITNPYELHPHRNKAYLEMIEKQEEVSYNKRNLIGDSVHVCKRCKSTKCVSTQAQLRSADESMSVLITCLDCDYRMRYG